MRERASAAFAIKKIGRGVPPLPTEFGWERAFPSMYKSKEWDRGAPLFPSKALRGSQRPLPQGERAKRLAPREWPNGLAFVPANAGHSAESRTINSQVIEFIAMLQNHTLITEFLDEDAKERNY